MRLLRRADLEEHWPPVQPRAAAPAARASIAPAARLASRAAARALAEGMRLGRSIAGLLLATTSFGAAASLSAASADKAACVAAYEAEQTARKDGRLREARDKALFCAQAACPAVVRDQCTQWIAEIDQSMPTVVFSVTDDAGNDVTDVEVWVDGVKLVDKLDGKAVAIDPGKHALKLVPASGAPVEQTIVVREGEKNREVKRTLAADRPEASTEPGKQPDSTAPDDAKSKPQDAPATPPPELPRERPTPAAVYVLGAVGLVGLGVFTTFAVLGMQNKTSLDNSGCRPNCAQSDVDRVKQQFLIGDLGLGLGVVSLGAAAIVYLTRGEAPPPEPKAGWSWQLAPSRDGAMGVVRLTF